MYKFIYKGVFVGKGLILENPANSFFIEFENEFLKKRIPFYKDLLNCILTDSNFSSNDWRIIYADEQFFGSHPKVNPDTEILTFERIQKADNEEFDFFYTKGNSPFSQFYNCNFEIDGVQFCSSEQFYAYSKAKIFNDNELADEILTLTDSLKQKKAGKRVKNFDPAKWHEISRFIVYQGNYAKFSQNKKLKDELLKTGTKTLVEDSPRDKIWGIGLKAGETGFDNRNLWLGINWLGEALIQVREDLKSNL